MWLKVSPTYSCQKISNLLCCHSLPYPPRDTPSEATQPPQDVEAFTREAKGIKGNETLGFILQLVVYIHRFQNNGSAPKEKSIILKVFPPPFFQVFYEKQKTSKKFHKLLQQHTI